MRFKFRHTEKIVGLFVFIAFAILIASFVMLSISRNMFVKTHEFRTLLSDAAGLSTSTPLHFKGYEIGYVKSFFLDELNRIDVQLAIYKQYRNKIVPGSAIYRQTNPISGETSLVFLLPRSTTDEPVTPIGDESTFLLSEGDYIPSLDMPDGQQMLAEKIIEKSGDSVSIIFDEAKEFFTNLRSEFQLKKDSFRTFFKKLEEFTESLSRNRDVFDHIGQLLDPKEGPVFEATNQFVEISSRLNRSVMQLEQILENYKNPDGILLKMMKLEKNQLDEILTNINKNLETMYKTLEALKEQSPMIADVLEKSRKTLEAVNNNPLLRGGIPKEEAPASTSHKKRLDPEEEK